MGGGMDEVDGRVGDAGEVVGVGGGEFGCAVQEVVDEDGVQVGVDRGRELAGLLAAGERVPDRAADLLVVLAGGVLR